MEHLEISEFRLLLQSTKKPKQRLMLKVMYHHGLRVTETLSLRAHDCRNGKIRVQRLKGSEYTKQEFAAYPGDPELDEAAELQTLLATLKPTDLLFPMSRSGVWRMMQRVGKRLGLDLDLCHPHVLKHSIAMHTIQDAGIQNVRKHLGHKSIASTGHYLKVTDEQAGKAIRGALTKTLASAA